MIGAPANPGCVVASRIAGSVTTGSWDSRLTVLGPVPIENATRSKPGLALASRIAWRRLPGPESLALITVNVAAVAGAATTAGEAAAPIPAARATPARNA